MRGPYLAASPSNSKLIPKYTDGNQGIGYETAKNLVLSSQDYHVILGSRDISKGEAAVEGVKGTVSSTQIDVTDDRLDVLVNNAGIVSLASPPTRETFRHILETNAVGSLSVTEAFLDLLRKAAHKPSRLVFVSSSTGSITHAADPNLPYHNAGGAMEYRISKAAVNMMMVMYYARLKPEGLLVFGADPGLCATNFTENAAALRNRGAAEAWQGGERVASVIKGDDVGRVLGVYSVSPW
ncbi:hypothetical protein M434DRAFT_387820 [Hypoxylon sp. CO27-5]|nr:hypothetical protein M434DRAFT_387820 [Hypoxylon sp. CO27-5]